MNFSIEGGERSELFPKFGEGADNFYAKGTTLNQRSHL